MKTYLGSSVIKLFSNHLNMYFKKKSFSFCNIKVFRVVYDCNQNWRLHTTKLSNVDVRLSINDHCSTGVNLIKLLGAYLGA